MVPKEPFLRGYKLHAETVNRAIFSLGQADDSSKVPIPAMATSRRPCQASDGGRSVRSIQISPRHPATPGPSRQPSAGISPSPYRTVPSSTVSDRSPRFRATFQQSHPPQAQEHPYPLSRRSSFADVAVATSAVQNLGPLLPKYHDQLLHLDQVNRTIEQDMDKEMNDADAALFQPLGPPPRLPSLRPLHGPSLQPLHAKVSRAKELMQTTSAQYEDTLMPFANAMSRELDCQTARAGMDSSILATREAIARADASCRVYDREFEGHKIRLQQLEGELGDLLVEEARLLTQHTDAARECVELLQARSIALQAAADAQHAWLEAARRYVTTRAKLVRRGLQAWLQVLAFTILLCIAQVRCAAGVSQLRIRGQPAPYGIRLLPYLQLAVFALIPLLSWYEWVGRHVG
ncbi:hypothetical protein SLS60_007544 [Paraconiothyrium brasiliense]|uniref:Uncharacterized protein n=1 Tax=Paraconiothyrium brasiliense TaxID=300254 RepID=A0ABR3R5N4_9PLEO